MFEWDFPMPHYGSDSSHNFSSGVYYVPESDTSSSDDESIVNKPNLVQSSFQSTSPNSDSSKHVIN